MILIGGALTYFNDSLVSEIADVVYRGDLGEKFLEQLSAIDHRMSKEEMVSTLETEHQETIFLIAWVKALLSVRIRSSETGIS